MKIAIGCDHGALALKNALMERLTAQGHEVKDFGTYTEDSCDYPDFAAPAARSVAFQLVDTWLNTEFSHAERHQRRIDKVMALENR